MALFNEGVSTQTLERPDSEGMEVRIGDELSPEIQDQLRRLASDRPAEPSESVDPPVELPSAEDMDLEKPLLPPAEAAPAAQSVSTELAETALSSALQPEAEAKPEKQVDHSRHDSSRQHAKDVHHSRTAPSQRNEYAVQRRSEKALQKLVSTYGLEDTAVTPQSEQGAEKGATPAEAQAPVERPKPAPPVERPKPAPPKQAAEVGMRPVVELKPRQVNVSDDHHEDTLQPSQRPAEKAMPRKEFVKQQEELWGAKDKISPEDVPEGEMTYEQYLAQRPTAEEGDYYHENGRIHDAVTGRQVKRADYEDEKLHEDANKARDNYYDAVALEQNEQHDASMSDIVRDNTEGEVLVKKDIHLQGLYDLGQELKTLYNSAHGKKFEKNVKDPLEAKAVIFNDLLALYSQKGYDERALRFISDKANTAIGDKKTAPIEDLALHKGDKVKVVDFVETEAAPGTETQKTYTVEHKDGLVETVNGDEVEFKRDYNPEKESTFDRVKNFFKREGRKLREYGGAAYFNARWYDPVVKWLNERNITDDMKPAEIEAQKEKNRRHNLIGLGVVSVLAVAGIRYGFFTGTSGGEHALADAVPQGMGAHGQGVDHFQHVVEASNVNEVAPAISQPDLLNPAYNIPDGGTLDQVFGSVGVNPATWQQHAQELYAQYPNVFYEKGGDIRIADPGWFPEPVRATIESFKG